MDKNNLIRFIMTLSNEFKVGLTILLATCIMVVFFIWSETFQKNGTTYYAYFNDVHGLKKGDPITYRGMVVGNVESLNFENEFIKVEMNIHSQLKLFQDASAEIIMSNLMSGKKINVFVGRKEMDVLPEFSMIYGETTSDLPNLVSSASSMLDSLEMLSRTVNLSFRKINSIISDEYLIRNFKKTLANIGEISDDIKHTTKSLNKIEFERLLTNMIDISEDIKLLVKKYDPRIDTTVKKVDAVMSQVNQILSILNPMLLNLSVDKKTLAGKILNDTLFMQRLDSSIKYVNSLLEETKKHGGVPIKFKL